MAFADQASPAAAEPRTRSPSGRERRRTLGRRRRQLGSGQPAVDRRRKWRVCRSGPPRRRPIHVRDRLRRRERRRTLGRRRRQQRSGKPAALCRPLHRPWQRAHRPSMLPMPIAHVAPSLPERRGVRRVRRAASGRLLWPMRSLYPRLRASPRRAGMLPMRSGDAMASCGRRLRRLLAGYLRTRQRQCPVLRVCRRKLQLLSGAAVCTACSAGTYSSESHATECTSCPKGGWCPEAGASSALVFRPCMVGTYNPNTGAESNASCLACPPGKANPVPGSDDVSACKPCHPGSHAPINGTDVCVLCPMGTYQDASGETVCESCSDLDDCSVGQYHAGCSASSAGSCTPCSAQAGRYFTSHGGLSDSCATSACADLAACAVGSYRAGCEVSSEGFCTPCTNKADTEYYTGHGQLSDACPKATCDRLTCAAGSVRVGSCGVDETRSNNEYACEPCAPGSFHDATSGMRACGGSTRTVASQAPVRVLLGVRRRRCRVLGKRATFAQR